MSTWDVWKPAYDSVTLSRDGDPTEQRAANEHGLEDAFPNYSAFWRYHVVPATNRPANLDIRQHVAPEVSVICQASHAILVDLVDAADELEKIRSSNLGGARFTNCWNAIKHDGNAVQKFKKLHDAVVEGLVSGKLGRTAKLWDRTEWDTNWSPARERIIGYRNFVTHTSQPYTVTKTGDHAPYVLHPDHVDRGNDLNWAQQETIYKVTPEKFLKLTDACELLHTDTVSWLNKAYAEVIRVLNPFLVKEEYHWLWGWDTPSNGSHKYGEARGSGQGG